MDFGPLKPLGPMNHPVRDQQTREERPDDALRIELGRVVQRGVGLGAGSDRGFDPAPRVVRGGPFDRAADVFVGRHTPPAIEHPAVRAECQDAWLEVALRVGGLPVIGVADARLEETEALVHEQVEPAALATGPGDLVVGIPDDLEVESPLPARAVRKHLRLARDGVDLTPRCPDLLRDPRIHVAP